ncbi:MAG: hypothetical protein ACJ79A_06315 [Gemmatimonadaceae bacterium]
MTTTSHASDDLFHALATRARATSDGRLVLAVISGLAATLGMAVWRPVGWLIIGSIGVCAAAFGAWGIADRELAERGAMNGSSVVVLRVVRVVSVVLGACAALVAALVVLGAVLGTWIS